jgi:glyoxylase-like metal-dependent hydrolase (beta-lactamase superfamily II)
MIRLGHLLSLVLVTTLASCEGPAGDPGPAGPQGPPGETPVDPDLAPLDKAILAAGGEEALAALGSLRVESHGTRRIALEGHHPDDPAAEASTFDVTLSWDLAGDRLRLDYRRVHPVWGGAETTFSEVVVGDVGWLDGVESVFGQPGGAMLSDRWAATRKQARLLWPHRLLADLAADPSAASDGGVALLDGEIHQLVVVADTVHPITLWVNAKTGRLDKLATLESDPLLGDIALEAFYLDWQPAAGGLRIPSRVVLAAGGQLLHEETRDSIEVGPALEIEIPDGAAPTYVAADAARGERRHQWHEAFAAFGVPLDGQQTQVVASEIATGVWHLTGGSHHSLVIEQSDGLVVVEAPLYEARAQAILDWTDATFPGKTVTHVILTHHHRDHVGAIRTFIARGATVVVGEASAAFFAEVARARRTIEPDELSAAPAEAEIVAVAAGGSITVADGARPVVAVAADSVHAADMVFVHLPGQRILFESDLYSPGFPAIPFFAAEVERNVDARGLGVDTLVGGHGFGTSSYAEFLAAF